MALATRYPPNVPMAALDARIACLMVITLGAYRRAASSV
jgi:hypothetical protein